MGNIADGDLRKKRIEQFRVENAEKLKDDHDFLRYLRDMHDVFYENHEKKFKEIEYNWKMYDNDAPFDNFDEQTDFEEIKKTFSSGLVAQITDRFCAILTSQNPKPNVNPVMAEGFYDNFIEMIKPDETTGEPGLPDEWMAWVAENGALQFDENGMVVGVDKDLLQEWFNSLSDMLFSDYMVESNYSVKIDILAKWASLTEKGWWKTRICETGEFPRLEIESVETQNVMDDPAATSRDTREAVIHIKPMRLSRAEQLFDLKPGTLKPCEKYSMRKDSPNWDDLPESEKYKIPRVLVSEFCLRDDTSIDIEGEKIMLYPSGRIITAITGQDSQLGMLVVKDQKNDFSDWPIQDLLLKPKNEIFGKPPIRDIIYFQNILDEDIQLQVKNMRMTGSNKFIYEDGSVDDIENLSNDVGEKIKVSHMGGIDYKPGVSIDGAALNFALFVKQFARDTSGVQEATEGKKPSDVQSGRALQVLQNAVDKLFRPASQRLEDFLNRVFSIWGSVAPFIYTEGRKIRYGDDLKQIAVLPFDLSIFIDSFDVFISSGTMLPRDELSHINMLISLASTPAEDGLPIIPRKFLLEELKIEGRAKIEKQIQDRLATDQKMQEMMQQMQMLSEQNEKLQGAVEQISQENMGMKIKMAGSEIKTQAGLQQQAMKEQGMAQRQQMDGQAKVAVEQTRGQYDLLKETINKGNKGSE